MKKNLLVFLISVPLLFASMQLFAWGQKGHDIIAYIAENHLSKNAQKNLSKILDGKSLVYYSSWMDNIQNSPYWENGYDITKTWHYYNIDEGYTIETMPREPEGDILSALQMVMDSLKNANLNDSLKVCYTKMLIHLVGDVHCPMHTARKSDRGGNEIKLKWFGSQTSLHGLWDSKLLNSVHDWTYTEWQKNIDRCSKTEMEKLSEGTPKDWLLESWTYANDIYENTPAQKNYSYQYIYDYQDVLEHQLLAAGYRLAKVLNEIFDC